MESLAFVLFIITEPHSGFSVEMEPQVRMDCRYEAPLVADLSERDGFIVDYLCSYGNGPLTSPRPVARPVRWTHDLP